MASAHRRRNRSGLAPDAGRRGRELERRLAQLMHRRLRLKNIAAGASGCAACLARSGAAYSASLGFSK